MARTEHPIHEFIANQVTLADDGVVVDLGCGQGGGLAALARHWPGASLIGFDRKSTNLDASRQLLERVGQTVDLRVVDLDGSLPMSDESVDASICHNVLECLANPIDLLNETARVLRPGAVALWAHTDFDTIVVNTPDVELSRRVLHAYADQTQPWMAHSDGRMGRQLAGIVWASDLELVGVDAHVLTATQMNPEVEDRIINITDSLRGVCTADVDQWRDELDQSISSGTFFFAETSFVAISRRSGTNTRCG